MSTFVFPNSYDTANNYGLNMFNNLMQYSPSAADYISGAPTSGFTNNWLQSSQTPASFNSAISAYGSLVDNSGSDPLGSILDFFGLGSSDSNSSVGTNNEQIGFGFNMPTLELGIKGLSALGNLWSGYQANKMAQRQYDLAKEAYQTNLANSIKSYNTALTDRIRARAAMETGDKNAYDSYLEENKL